MNVLIVDDEELIRRSLRRVFEMAGHSVAEAGSGVEGLSLWKKGSPDIVLLDVLMPGLTGPQVIQKMEQPIAAKVILMSAYSGDYNLERVKNIGADLFIPKPFQNIFDIVKMAERLLDK